MADLGFRVNQVIKTEVDVTQAQLVAQRRRGHHRARQLPRRHPRARRKLARPEPISKRPPSSSPPAPSPPISPNVPLNGRTIINSDQILNIPDIPKTLIVVGGGVIGVEYTCMFAILGVRVILVEKRPRLLEFADSEMVEALSYHLRDNRVTMRLNEEVASVEEMPAAASWREPEEQEDHQRRCPAVRRRPAGQCGRAEPGRRGHRSRQPRPHSGGRRLPHQGAEHLRGRRRHRLSRAWHPYRWSRAASPRRTPWA